MGTGKGIAIFVVILSMAIGTSVRAQHIVLRDLTLVENANIESIDIDGLVLKGGMRFSWADVLQGNVGDQQVAFDSAIKNIGLPLFRIGTRMAKGDFNELQPMADELLTQAGDSQGRTAYIALAAQFQDHLRHGRRESAAAPLIRLVAIRDTSSDLAALDSRLGLRFSDDGICLDLLPVWFDKQAAKNTVTEISKLPNSSNSASNVYLLSLKNMNRAKGDDQASATLDVGWQTVLTAQSALLNGNSSTVPESLDNSGVNLNTPQQVIALYYLGMAMRDLQSKDPERSTDQWKLKLLQIPAQYQDQFPELAAAAIYQVLGGSKNNSHEYESLQKELTGRFSGTWHGRRYQSRRK